MLSILSDRTEVNQQRRKGSNACFQMYTAVQSQLVLRPSKAAEIAEKGDATKY